jgi:hypothetical protein
LEEFKKVVQGKFPLPALNTVMKISEEVTVLKNMMGLK